ncbi:MAG: hypothetical protein L3J14_05265 [Flavobacteriaceae bacterium]|nr:hypothetical protein [Flavobacteriaceae bacterium]
MKSYKEAIGGFFESEDLDKCDKEYYNNLYKFNSGRNSLEVILEHRQIRKIYLPSFFCNVIIEPIEKLSISIDFYNVNENLEIEEEIFLNKNEVLLYINYFGIKQNYIEKLATKYKNLIIDNSQAFFDKPIVDIDTFYSPRKFFGVPDGSYLSTNLIIDTSLYETANSKNRISHLIKRKELGSEKAYADFIQNEKKLNSLPIQLMSSYTNNILKTINYNKKRRTRRENFEVLHSYLEKFNKLPIHYSDDTVPLCYPLYIDNGSEIRNKLIKNRIYVPKYWPNLNGLYKEDSITKELVENIIALPLDHRYDIDDMNFILKVLKENIN